MAHLRQKENAMAKQVFEVLFRAEDERAMLAWKPNEASQYGCTALEARKRFDDLIARGSSRNAVDGAVPFLVEIRAVRRKERKEGPCAQIDFMLAQYCEPEAIQWGPWAQETPSFTVLN
jgi:hypothetical protein